MKLLRYGDPGREKPGLLDSDGSIRDLSGVIADVGVNVVGIEHRREGVLHSGLGDVEVSIQVELRGPDHIKELIARLEDEGYEVTAL